MVPAILALVDDSSMKFKTAGCSHLSLFLQCELGNILERTGLGEIFDEALMPCLMYLPTLTEEAEAVGILEQAYPALIRLACVRFPEPACRALRMESLVKIMRHGILRGYAHAGEQVKIAEVLVRQIVMLVKEMGIDVATFLKVRHDRGSVEQPMMTRHSGCACPALKYSDKPVGDGEAFSTICVRGRSSGDNTRCMATLNLPPSRAP